MTSYFVNLLNSFGKSFPMKRNVRKTENIHNPAATVGILISRLVTGFFSWLLVS